MRNIRMTMNNFDMVFGTYFPELKASPLIVFPSDSSEQKGLVDQKEVQRNSYRSTGRRAGGRVREEELERSSGRHSRDSSRR